MKTIEEITEYRKQYYQNNKKKISKKSSEYYWKNKKSILNKQKEKRNVESEENIRIKIIKLQNKLNQLTKEKE